MKFSAIFNKTNRQYAFSVLAQSIPSTAILVPTVDPSCNPVLPTWYAATVTPSVTPSNSNVLSVPPQYAGPASRIFYKT